MIDNLTGERVILREGKEPWTTTPYDQKSQIESVLKKNHIKFEFCANVSDVTPISSNNESTPISYGTVFMFSEFEIKHVQKQLDAINNSHS